jgi:hypothetical protein
MKQIFLMKWTRIDLMYFINRQSNNYHETVDEYETKAEALKVLPEYQFSEHGRAFYYVSQVSQNNWKN